MSWEFEITNIGGILEGEAQLEPGLNAVKASNWQGKSSFIEAIKAALGVSKQLTEGKKEARVWYSGPDRSGTVWFDRNEGTVTSTGDPLLTDEYDIVRTSLFACLDETNEIRRAVRDGDNLEEPLLHPLDFENIDARLSDLRHEREQISAEIDRVEQANKRLPAAQEEVTQLENEIEELRQEYDKLQADEGSAEGEARSKLAETESERKQVQSKIQRLKDSIERTKSAIEEKRDELDDLTVPEVNDTKSELDTVRKRLQGLERDKKVLESVHSATEMMLQENRLDLVTEVTREIDGDRFACWTCGENTSRDAVESQVTELREKIAKTRSEIEERRSRLEKLEAKQERTVQKRKRRETLKTEIAELEEKLSTNQESLENARDRLTTLDDRIEDISETVDDSVDQRTDIESTLKYREAKLQDARENLEELEQRAGHLETLEAQRSEIADEIEQLRNRKERIKRETREEFDVAIENIVARFETGFESARLTADFELVVARDGREASLEALSEGELELLGFAVALAGYRAFNVCDISPFILIDRVGGLAEHNLHTLVDFLYDETPYIVFTTYPEHGEIESHAIQHEAWQVSNV